MRVSDLLLRIPTVSSLWSDLFAVDDGDWGSTWWGKVVQVVVILLIAGIVRLVSHRVIQMVVNRIVSGAKRRRGAQDTQALLNSPVSAARVVQRTRTLGSVLNNVLAVVIIVVALISIVTVINSNITSAFSLITAALGAGLGFGAQNLVKDVLTGLFIVSDDQLGVGDIVDTDLATGIVENVGIRVTQIRDVNGVLWYVRNGELTRIGNRSQGWSRAIVDVTVPNTADVEQLQHRLLDAAKAAVAMPEYRGSVTETPELWGLESVTADGVVLRIVARTTANQRDDVAWAIRTHLREALEDAGISDVRLSSDRLAEFEYAGALRGVRPPRTGSTPIPRRRTTRRASPSIEPTPSGSVPPQRPRTTARGTNGASGASGATGRTGPKASDDGSDG
ncbi:mechanosensitive ion channel protein MscS [Amnibacterium setariae]|uniref:Mechanosensitive ion channel protein MscS n=1 Tax=Amnibacterium setariae TaxID=2306585 RepID=A0A3A1U328_9MICO|nr:mechanosensitive ion channel protein MscS [Amnibacterium setariae]